MNCSNYTISELEKICYQSDNEIGSYLASRCIELEQELKSYEKSDDEVDVNYTNIETMHWLLTTPSKELWIKSEDKDSVSYTVSDMDSNFHYENHEIKITKNKGSNTWHYEIYHSALGESLHDGKIQGGFKEAQKHTIQECIKVMQYGGYLIRP